MGQPRRYRLKEDALSAFRDKRGKPIVYGERGSIVTEVSRSLPALIVEDANKQRFPVHISKLVEL